MLQDLLQWDDVVAKGFDASLYLILAVAGTALFLIRMGMSLIGGDAGVDDFDTDGDIGDASGDFSLFSLFSILAFLMGAGWMGLAARLDWNLGSIAAAFVASGSGLVMMFIASGIAYSIRKLSTEARYDVETAVGRTGSVYLTVPAKGEGRGQVEVNVSGRRKIMNAVSEGPSIEAFADVVVVGTHDDETLTVRPKYPQQEDVDGSN